MHNHRPVPARALLAMFAGAAGIAMAPILVRLSDVGPTATAFWRCLLAVPVILLILGFRQGRRAPITGASTALLAAGGFFAADLALWHVSILWTTVANASLLANLAPFFVASFAFFVRGDKPGFSTRLALIAAAIGVYLLTDRAVELGGRARAGVGFGLLTAVCYAGYMIAVAKARVAVDTMRVSLATSAVAALCLAPIAWLFGETLLPAGFHGWLVLAALALVSQVAGQGLIVYAFAHLPVTFGALALMLQPVLAALLAWGLFGEAMTMTEIVGGVVVLAAIALARRDTTKPSQLRFPVGLVTQTPTATGAEHHDSTL